MTGRGRDLGLGWGHGRALGAGASAGALLGALALGAAACGTVSARPGTPVTSPSVASTTRAGTRATDPTGTASASAARVTPARWSAAPWSSCRADVGRELDLGASRRPALTRLTAPIQATAVVLCSTGTRIGLDGSQELVGEEHRLSDPAAVATLTAALRRPDAPAYQGACTGVGYLEPLLFVLDAGGHWIRPALPVEPCGAPQSAARAAVAAVARRPAISWPIRQIMSAGAARSRCPEQWKDMVHVDTSVSDVARAADSTGDPFPHGSAVRACAYRVPASEVGSDGPAGTFERGAVLSGARRTRLGTLLATGRSAGGCTTDATRFEVLQPAGGQGPTVYVELDGCRRVLTETVVGSREVARLARSSPALLDLLATIG